MVLYQIANAQNWSDILHFLQDKALDRKFLLEQLLALNEMLDVQYEKFHSAYAAEDKELVQRLSLEYNCTFQQLTRKLSNVQRSISFLGENF